MHQTLAFVILAVHGIALAQTPVWTQFPNSPAGTARNDDIFFADLTNGWSARGTNGVYRTTNSGNAWIKVIPNTNPVAHFRCVGFASATRGWAGNLGPGSYDGAVTDTNMLYETFNGGASWNPVPAISQPFNNLYLDAISFSQQSVPEPTAVALFGLGTMLFGYRSRLTKRP